MGTFVLNHLSNSVEQTETLAEEFARSLKGGECIALHGDLGAGKTQFVRGLLRGLGGNPQAVSSPTFVLLNVYDGQRMKLFHLDAYRLTGADDLQAIGFNELLEQNGIVVVEWASRVAELLPPQRIEITITPTGETARQIQIESSAS